jgi:KaiC/GvpD/RAD55 family RecA-like ATPase
MIFRPFKERMALEIDAKGLPSELRRFFMGPGGHSLILRGNAGTGKTTFALQMIEELDEIESSFYFSTRVSDSLLLMQFPWLAKKVHGPIAGQMVAEDIHHSEEGELESNDQPSSASEEEMLPRLWFNKLKLRGAFGFENKPGQSFPQNRVDLMELERIYSTVEKCGGRKTLVVVDSVDALAEACGINQATVITAVQKDLVEGRKINIIFLMESNDRYLDYLGDGVVELAILEHHRRRLREINVLKARGCAIQQPKYLFTLNDARIQAFSDRAEISHHSIRGWKQIVDNGSKVSLGLADLDRLMKGGIAPGSILLIELGHGVQVGVSSLIEQAIVANFASARRGVLWVPLKKETADSVRNRMSGMIGKEVFDKSVRIPEIASQVEDTNSHYIMPIEGTAADADLKWKNVVYALREAAPPFLSIMGFDALESIYGGKVMDQMTDHFTAVKRNRSIFVGLVSPSTRSTERLADLATHHLKVDRIGGTVVLYGIEPFTECNALTMDEGKDATSIHLVPII